jgi:hypothetical protein
VENLTCIAWGDLRDDKIQRGSHLDCPVVVTSPQACAVPVTVPLPAVCLCGCRTCKDAWFADGKPICKEGRIVRETDESNGLRFMDVVSAFPSEEHVFPKLPKLWWLSFADADLPEGHQFLGVCVVFGIDLKDAIVRSHMAKCNPGGGVKAGELPESSARKMPRNKIDILLSKKEALRLSEEISKYD